MKNMKYVLILLLVLSLSAAGKNEQRVWSFNQDWKFTLGDSTLQASAQNFNDNSWRKLNLPHDWSIESDFGKDFPATAGGGALPGGLGWYRKTFTVDKVDAHKRIYIDFDGVYRNSEVWINGTSVGKRPYGYISFRYDLTPYLKFGAKNVIAVKVDNSKEPNSRWYSGSGIFRNVWLTTLNPVHVDLWGTYVTTPEVSEKAAKVAIETTVKNTTSQIQTIRVEQALVNAAGRSVATTVSTLKVAAGISGKVSQALNVANPIRWNIENPYMYKVVTSLYLGAKQVDRYETPVGIRSFVFDVHKGFILNGTRVKINGVCNHHDLGALGAAVNTRAIERQLQILKDMGCNGIRCSHNPPAPELLDLCDKMGFIVMDEAFDMWEKKKVTFDYSLDFKEWHERDLSDLILRDRNHPSVFIWSIGNEVGEQWGEAKIDDTDLQKANIQLNNRKVTESEDTRLGKLGKYALLTKHLADITKLVDPTRPVSAACNGTGDNNPLFQSGALDLIGFNYNETQYAGITHRFPTKPFFSSESVSALQTRGFYLMPSDSMNIWPETWDKPFFNPLQKCSAYDNSHAPWGSTHEATWKEVKKYDHVAGQFIWTGFDYLGEPTPYWWPSRSSYFGIIDLAGFPKDIYYMYQSEWTSKDVLYIFPHWNWKAGQTIDVWAYYNNADEVELYLNGQSVGKRSKAGDDLHVMWRLKYEPGTLKAISRKNGKQVLSREIKTAGTPVSIRLKADRSVIAADGKDLSYVTVELLDKDGNASPLANELVKFTAEGEGAIVGTDNGDQNDHVSLKKPERHLFYGKCLAIIQNTGKKGKIVLKASVEGMPGQELTITAN